MINELRFSHQITSGESSRSFATNEPERATSGEVEDESDSDESETDNRR